MNFISYHQGLDAKLHFIEQNERIETPRCSFKFVCGTVAVQYNVSVRVQLKLQKTSPWMQTRTLSKLRRRYM
jgi:hypothetical protein